MLFYIPSSGIILNSMGASITTLKNHRFRTQESQKTVLKNCLAVDFSVFSKSGQSPHHTPALVDTCHQSWKSLGISETGFGLCRAGTSVPTQTGRD